MAPPRIVALSGSLSSQSTVQRLTAQCADELERLGATVELFSGRELEFPFYRAGSSARAPEAARFLDAIEGCDGVVLASPTYHGTISGVLKNALDHVNDLERSPRPFLEGRPVGCLTMASGAQGAASTLATLRTIAHALRGWPTPLGVAVTGSAREPSAEDVEHVCQRASAQLRIMAGQVMMMATLSSRRRERAERPPAAGRVA